MQSATFRTWLAERGCSFEQHERAKGGLGHASVTVRRGQRSAVLPLVGSHQRLDAAVVSQVVRDLGLDPAELPGPASRV